jgi:hypothetical protein
MKGDCCSKLPVAPVPPPVPVPENMSQLELANLMLQVATAERQVTRALIADCITVLEQLEQAPSNRFLFEPHSLGEKTLSHARQLLRPIEERLER